MTPTHNPTAEAETRLRELASRKGRALNETPRQMEPTAEQQPDVSAGDSTRLVRQFGVSYLCIGFDEHPTPVHVVTAYAVAKALVERLANDLRATVRLSVTGQLAESEIVRRLVRRERVATGEIEQWFQDNRGR